VALGSNQTPTGAFSYDGRAYVFAFCEDEPTHFGSYLTASANPAESPVFDKIFELSRDGKFMQVAPCVVQNAAVNGLPSTEGDGLILFGNDHSTGVYLAWMPLFHGRDPDKSQVRYWAGPGGWSVREDSAKLLFSKTGWTSLSVGRIEELGVWILLNQTAVLGPGGSVTAEESVRGRIVARVAGAPWDLANADEVVLFDPERDDPEGRFLRHPAGNAYGAYLLNRYTRWNDSAHTVTIWYLLSPFDPYQVQLMRSQITITAEFIGEFGRTPANYRPVCIYAVTEDGNLMWYRKDSPATNWQGPVSVGSGWAEFQAALPAGGNALFAIEPGGVLKWYRHDGFNDGRVAWKGPVDIGTGWGAFIRVFAGSDGILYAIQPDGTLLWYCYPGFAGGSGLWEGPKTVGSGWAGFTNVFGMGQGIIYAVQPDGTLLWYEHQGFRTGAPAWSRPRQVGTGWNVFRDIVPVGDGIIIASRADGEVFWYRHTDYQTGVSLGGGRSRTSTTESAHWEGPVLIGQHWQGYRKLIGLLPATPTGPH
jgi:hypothetical protein